VYIVAYLRGEGFEVAQQGKVRGEPRPAEPGTHGERHIDGTGDETTLFKTIRLIAGVCSARRRLFESIRSTGEVCLDVEQCWQMIPSFELAGTCALLAHRVHCIPFTSGTLLLSSQMYRMLQNGRRWWNRPRRDVTLSTIAIRGRSLSCGC
jgi:hypothetical protein